MNKVKITICGIDYVIAGNEDEEYVLNLARKLDERSPRSPMALPMGVS